ncbi:MAG: L-aspartate oxidase [Planctomycetota bacterium]
MSELFDERRYLIPFRSTLLPQIFTDTLVVGAGIAGLTCAIEAAKGGDVIVLAKGELGESATAWAQGGVAAALESGDSPALHADDTTAVGAGLCDAGAVHAVTSEGPEAVRWLFEIGMNVDRGSDGSPSAGREGGHSVSRIYHAGGDATGAEIQRVLLGRARAMGAVRLFDGCFALDLITASDEPGARVLGAITYHTRYGLQMIWARSTVLASGGTGGVYRETTNPPSATADGVALAYRAGAGIADAAFVQFHPTVLYLPGASRALISEAVRGEGAHLTDRAGRRFMTDVHEMGELAPRDIVSRAIVREIAKSGAGGSGAVYLDCRHIGGFASRFPSIAATLERFGIDPSADLIPVHPAAHYMVGGVRTDLDGRTGVPGLYAAGEVSCSGLHGANRLASNSLLEGLVFGRRAATAAVEEGASQPPATPAKVVSDLVTSEHASLDLDDVRSSVRSAMWRNVGIEREGPKLAEMCEMLGFWARYTLDKILDEPEGWEVQNTLLAAHLIARSASWRSESRGAHWRSDAPEASDEYLVHDVLRRGSAEPECVPVDQPVTSGPGAPASA